MLQYKTINVPWESRLEDVAVSHIGYHLRSSGDGGLPKGAYDIRGRHLGDKLSLHIESFSSIDAQAEALVARLYLNDYSKIRARIATADEIDKAVGYFAALGLNDELCSVAATKLYGTVLIVDDGSLPILGSVPYASLSNKPDFVRNGIGLIDYLGPFRRVVRNMLNGQDHSKFDPWFSVEDGMKLVKQSFLDRWVVQHELRHLVQGTLLEEYLMSEHINLERAMEDMLENYAGTETLERNIIAQFLLARKFHSEDTPNLIPDMIGMIKEHSLTRFESTASGMIEYLGMCSRYAIFAGAMLYLQNSSAGITPDELNNMGLSMALITLVFLTTGMVFNSPAHRRSLQKELVGKDTEGQLASIFRFYAGLPQAG